MIIHVYVWLMLNYVPLSTFNDKIWHNYDAFVIKLIIISNVLKTGFSVEPVWWPNPGSTGSTGLTRFQTYKDQMCEVHKIIGTKNVIILFIY